MSLKLLKNHIANTILTRTLLRNANLNTDNVYSIVQSVNIKTNLKNLELKHDMEIVTIEYAHHYNYVNTFQN